MNDQQPEGAAEPPVQRNIPVLVSACFALLLFGIAGTLGALWFVQHHRHSTVAEQLTAARTEAAANRSGQQAAEARQADGQKKLFDAMDDQQKAAADRSSASSCADIGHEFTRAIKARDNAALQRAIDRMLTYCQ